MQNVCVRKHGGKRSRQLVCLSPGCMAHRRIYRQAQSYEIALRRDGPNYTSKPKYSGGGFRDEPGLREGSEAGHVIQE